MLTAADLNSSLTQITGNGEDLAWPATKAKDLDGQDLVLDTDGDSTLDAATDDIAVFTLRGQELFKMDGATDGTTVDGLTFQAAATGNDVLIKAQGSTTDIDIDIQPKGTGTILLDSVDPTTTAFVTSGTFADARISESSVTQHEAALTIVQSQISGLQDFELLDVQSPSAASSADFETGFSSTYSSYMFVVENIFMASTGDFYLRTDTSGGASYDAGASDYGWSYSYVFDSTGTPTQTLFSDEADDEIELTINTITPPDGISGTVHLVTRGSGSPAQGARFITQFSVLHPTGYFSYTGGGIRLSSATINAVRFLPGNSTFTGVIRMYGMRAA